MDKRRMIARGDNGAGLELGASPADDAPDIVIVWGRDARGQPEMVVMTRRPLADHVLPADGRPAAAEFGAWAAVDSVMELIDRGSILSG
jgi:hypothetical protein